jgi:two-component system, cell cycle response regulator
MKVLIIDDSPDALALARVRLSKEGLTLLCADRGREGLAMAAQELPDLILLDVDMPDMSGFDVCRTLKANAKLCMIPVVFLSGSVNSEDKIKGLNLGAVDYVTKPFDAFELRARVNAALRTKRMQDFLIERACIDPLTGLPNRQGLLVRLQQEYARRQRYGVSLSFIMSDIDHFKRINDTHGHIVGDRALCAVANAIANQCRTVDFPNRYGGEEFSILVPEGTASETARMAERCRKAVADVRLQVGEEIVSMTASFGVADMTDGDPPEAILENADQALYQAKHTGRNRVAVWQKEVSRDPVPV